MGINKQACELCGRKEERLSYSLVEGVKLKVCSRCKGFGKFAGEVEERIKEEPSRDFGIERQVSGQVKGREEEEEVVVSNYAELIKDKRERLGLSQKDFAMKLAEKESFVASLENGKMPINIEQAKRFGKILGLSLIIKEKAVHLASGEKTGALTIGDILLDKLGKK